MYVARLICSDPVCADERTVEAPTLRELELLACECGCTLEVIAWPDALEGEAQVVSLAAWRRRGPRVPEAA